MMHIVKVSALLLGSALLMFAGGLQGLLIAIRGGAEGFSLFALGLIGTSWSVGYIGGTLVMPALVRRVGHIRAFAVMGAVASIVVLLNLLVIDATAWIVLRAFSGFCFAGVAMIVESWLNEVTDNSRRGTTFSTYMAANLAFSTAGQMTLSLVPAESYVPFVLCAVAFSLAILPPALSATQQPKPLVKARLNLGLLYRTSPVAVFAAFTVGLAGGAFGTLAPIYGLRSGFDTPTIAYLMSLSIVVGAIFQLPFGRLSDRIDRRMVIAGIGLCAAVAGLALVLIDPGIGWLIYMLFALYGLSANSIYPVAVAHANDLVADNDFARVATGLLLLFGIGLAAGPIFASFAMTYIAPVSLFAVTATFHAALAVLALFRMRVRPRAVVEQGREPFRPVPPDRESTPQTVAMDPRVDEETLEHEEPHDDPTTGDPPPEAPDPEPKPAPAPDPDHDPDPRVEIIEPERPASAALGEDQGRPDDIIIEDETDTDDQPVQDKPDR